MSDIMVPARLVSRLACSEAHIIHYLYTYFYDSITATSPPLECECERNRILIRAFVVRSFVPEERESPPSKPPLLPTPSSRFPNIEFYIPYSDTAV